MYENIYFWESIQIRISSITQACSIDILIGLFQKGLVDFLGLSTATSLLGNWRQENLERSIRSWKNLGYIYMYINVFFYVGKKVVFATLKEIHFKIFKC